MEEETEDRWADDPRLLPEWYVMPQPGYPFRPLPSGTPEVGHCPETTWGYDPLRRHCLIYYIMLYQYHYYFRLINLFWYIEWPIYAFPFYIYKILTGYLLLQNQLQDHKLYTGAQPAPNRRPTGYLPAPDRLPTGARPASGFDRSTLSFPLIHGM